jgi:hypothetical protein
MELKLSDEDFEKQKPVGYLDKLTNRIYQTTQAECEHLYLPLYTHTPDSSARIAELEKAMGHILHSIKQARMPGNDWRRELKLIESIAIDAVNGASDEQ